VNCCAAAAAGSGRQTASNELLHLLLLPSSLALVLASLLVMLQLLLLLLLALQQVTPGLLLVMVGWGHRLRRMTCVSTPHIRQVRRPFCNARRMRYITSWVLQGLISTEEC
jgi:hypothetical protein